MKIHTGARISPAEAGLVLIQLSQGPAAANQIPDSSENRFVLKPDVRQQSTQHPVRGVASKKAQPAREAAGTDTSPTTEGAGGTKWEGGLPARPRDIDDRFCKHCGIGQRKSGGVGKKRARGSATHAYPSRCEAAQRIHQLHREYTEDPAGAQLSAAIKALFDRAPSPRDRNKLQAAISDLVLGSCIIIKDPLHVLAEGQQEQGTGA